MDGKDEEEVVVDEEPQLHDNAVPPPSNTLHVLVITDFPEAAHMLAHPSRSVAQRDTRLAQSTSQAVVHSGQG